MRLLIGLSQGALLYVLIYKNANQTSHVYFFESLYIVILLLPLLIIQGISTIRPRPLTIWCLCLTVLLVIITNFDVWKQLSPSISMAPSFLPTVIIGLFVGQALIISSDIERRFQATYETLFDISWKLGLQFVFTFIFVVFFWGLLLLGVYLLDLIEISFLKNLIEKPWCSIPITTLVIAGGLHLTDVQPVMIRNIRTLILTLFSWLLPLMTLIVTLFLIKFLFFDFTSFWQTHHATTLFISIAMVLILLINTAYQDGGAQKSQVKLIQYTTQLASIILTPIAATASYGLYLRVAQYGWSDLRIIGAAGLFIIDMYAIGYITAVFYRGPWLIFIERWNFYTAFVLLGTLLSILTPIADPARLMVKNQVHRLLTGAVAADKFDFNYLQLHGARFGDDALKNLQEHATGPQATYIREQAKKALSFSPVLIPPPAPFLESVVPPIPTIHLNSDAFIIVHPFNRTLPASFLQQNWHQNINVSTLPSCLLNNNILQSTRKCDAWLINLAGSLTVILCQSDKPDRVLAFQQEHQGQWNLIGQWHLATNCPRKYLSTLIANDNIKLVAPIAPTIANPDLEILGKRFPFITQVNETNCDIPE